VALAVPFREAGQGIGDIEDPESDPTRAPTTNDPPAAEVLR
jgi:hypothetical protein